MNMKRFKIGILDIIIIAFVIIGICLAAAYFSIGSQDVVVKAPEVIYKVEFKSVPIDVLDLFKAGDELKDSVKGGALGSVINVEIRDNLEIREDIINDRFVESSFGNKKDVVLTVKGKPTTFDKKNIKFATVNIKVGEMLYITTDKYTYSGYVIEMEKINDGPDAEEGKNNG